MKVSKKVKIGITSSNPSRIWNNGLGQNIWFVFRLLKNAGYDIDLVSQSIKIAGKTFYSEKVKTLAQDNCMKYDIIVEIAHGLTEELAQYYTDNGGHIVTIQYGNNFLVEMGEMIYLPDNLPREKRRRTEIWTSPHYEFALDAYRTSEKVDVKICPYIWSPDILVEYCLMKKYNPYFTDETEIGNIGILESNLYMVKTCIVPMLIAENLYDRDPKLIEHVYNYGSSILNKNKTFVAFANKLNLVSDQKMTFEDRYHLPYLIDKGILGTIVSHQWNNELNYLQLEAMYLGFPLIHNSPVFKTYGYYYNDFNVREGAEMLEYALQTHKDKYKLIREREREKVWEYDPKNPKNINGYIELFESFIEKYIKSKK